MNSMLPFDRDVYCIGGLPFDAVDLESTKSRLENSVYCKNKTFLSTPNLNWLRISRTDPAFREAAIRSDLSIADGMPIVLLSKLLSLPIKERAAGSDLIDLLIEKTKLTFFFFGGADGVGEKAEQNINRKCGENRIVGHLSPGFGSVADMSSTKNISDINNTNPDFVVVSLGALKGQTWILENLDKVTSPIMSHLGAVINFYADTVKRAPVALQKFGLEWLWRIYQEPTLGKRYFDDASFLMKEMIFRIIPYYLLLKKHAKQNDSDKASISMVDKPGELEIVFTGSFDETHSSKIRKSFTDAITHNKGILINLEHTTYITSSFIGLLLLMNKFCIENKLRFFVSTTNATVRKIFFYCGAEYLLD